MLADSRDDGRKIVFGGRLCFFMHMIFGALIQLNDEYCNVAAEYKICSTERVTTDESGTQVYDILRHNSGHVRCTV